MNPREDDQPPRGSFLGKTSGLQERVAQFYYAHGLFCSTYPVVLVVTAICITVLSCYPLLSLPFPGNAPLQSWEFDANESSIRPPFCYVQQVILKTAVLPWKSDLTIGDAFRAPLFESFKLLEAITNYQEENSSVTLGHVCLHVEAIRRNKASYINTLPQYSCLVLSPANLWHQNVQAFNQDSSLLTTIFNQHNLQKGKTSITEMVFGMRVFDTGFKRYPLRNRQRIIQFAITLFFKEYDEKFMQGLRSRLHSLYPLHQPFESNVTEYVLKKFNDTLFIHYPGELNLIEFIPITVAFILLFVYFYFSIRKIETIHSKMLMAVCSVITVFASLTMTYGLCFFFGLTLNLSGKEIFPYLVLLVGLENELCLTKSVISSPLHLDVKIRLAQGLSREGWSITKNLLLELTILTFGLFTFVPVIQEFCIFAIVGLLADYFMQMIFFTSVLGMDIKRKEILIEKTNANLRSNLYQSQGFYDKPQRRNTLTKSKSHPRLSSLPTDVVAGQAQVVQEKNIPKRLKLVNVWTRTRFFHRSFMILMVIWICNIAYNSSLIEHYILNNEYFQQKGEDINSNTQHNFSSLKLFPLLNTSGSLNKVTYVTHNPIEIKHQQNQTTEDLDKLKHFEYSPWMKLSPQHWYNIMKKYNLSLSGQYIIILPSIKLSHVINPDQASVLRNPNEKYGERFQWQALAAALDPIDFSGQELGDSFDPQLEQPFYPRSVFAMILITLLSLISIIVLGYLFVVFYRCICTRNYAEWRTSWYIERNEEHVEDQVLFEAVPVVLDGHQQEVECVATDGFNIVSSCLEGQVKVWDASTGELLTNIDRKSYFDCGDRRDSVSDSDDETPSDYELSPTHSENSFFPSLKRQINTKFSNTNNPRTLPSVYDSKSDFKKNYRQLYFNPDSFKSREVVKDDGRSLSEGSQNDTVVQNENLKLKQNSDKCLIGAPSPIWCIDYLDNLIVVGCANGRLEIWEGTRGILRTTFDDQSGVGITGLKLVGSKVVAARLHGNLDILQLQTYSHGQPIDWNFTCAYRRTNFKGDPAFSVINQNNVDDAKDDNSGEDLRCDRQFSLRAHQQPITSLECEGGRILTGSQDHSLKVFRLKDGSLQYTLHGHCGPITCLFIDRISPATSGSGSQDGMLCVWDLLTGACVYNIQAHDGTITALTYSASYFISLGSDDRLCVWERFQGHLLNTIYVSQTFASQVLMLTPHLVVTARSGGLVIWDVRSGRCVRTVVLGGSPLIFIKQLILLRDCVVCDYGSQLRVVRFPLITHKFD